MDNIEPLFVSRDCSEQNARPHTKCPGAFSGALFECTGPGNVPICVILQNTLEKSIHDGIINPKADSSMAIPMTAWVTSLLMLLPGKALLPTPTITRANSSRLRGIPPIPTMRPATP